MVRNNTFPPLFLSQAQGHPFPPDSCSRGAAQGLGVVVGPLQQQNMLFS